MVMSVAGVACYSCPALFTADPRDCQNHHLVSHRSYRSIVSRVRFLLCCLSFSASIHSGRIDVSRSEIRATVAVVQLKLLALSQQPFDF
jgi:hypothetical protein